MGPGRIAACRRTILSVLNRPNAPSRPPTLPLTLDQALSRLQRETSTLAAQWLEIPQARADTITAGQRANSLLFIGGGKEGPVRLRPLDFPPKHWARALAAGLAAHVLEAQYRDAVRTRTADLYTAYVDVQEAQEQARFARASLERLEPMMKRAKVRAERGQGGQTELAGIAAVQARAAVSVDEAEVALHKARHTLADLLSVPDAEADRLEVGDVTDAREPSLPAIEALTRLALAHRPDLNAYRLGLWRAGVTGSGHGSSSARTFISSPSQIGPAVRTPGAGQALRHGALACSSASPTRVITGGGSTGTDERRPVANRAPHTPSVRSSSTCGWPSSSTPTASKPEDG